MSTSRTCCTAHLDRWLVLVLVQSSLIRSRDFRLHRILGWSSIALFAVLIVTSWHMVRMMWRPANRFRSSSAKLFAYSDVTALPLLVIAYAGAIYYRKDRHLHSRLDFRDAAGGLLPRRRACSTDLAGNGRADLLDAPDLSADDRGAGRRHLHRLEERSAALALPFASRGSRSPTPRSSRPGIAMVRWRRQGDRRNP